MTHRTYYFANALYVAESGTEEALAMMNHGGGNCWGDGWSASASKKYTNTVTNFFPLTGGSSIGIYIVNVLNPTSAHPVIVCTGIVDAASASFGGTVNTTVY